MHKKRILAILFILIGVIFVFGSCNKDKAGEEEKKGRQENQEIDLAALEAVIDGFDGEIFSNRDITANGAFGGYEKLESNNTIYCGDTGNIIWWDDYHICYYRLNHRDEKIKICQNEICRNNTEGECFHVLAYNVVYSNGFIYFVSYGGEYNGVIICRYNIDTYEYEKLMEFPGVTECEIALNGRYLYARIYSWANGLVYYRSHFKVDLSVVRIDLSEETAVVIYSDYKNPNDVEKIGNPEEFIFMWENIVMPVVNYAPDQITEYKEGMPQEFENMPKIFGSSINICDMDMYGTKTLIKFDGEEVIRNLYTYENDIYFLSYKGLSRVNMDAYNKYIFDPNGYSEDAAAPMLDTKQREVLNRNIINFSIDGDFLYYNLLGEAGKMSTVYRVKLDYTRELDFKTAVVVYTQEDGRDFTNWKVYKDYLYARIVIMSESGRGSTVQHFRQKINSSDEPYIFYEVKTY